jgi:hypothetical protein
MGHIYFILDLGSSIGIVIGLAVCSVTNEVGMVSSKVKGFPFAMRVCIRFWDLPSILSSGNFGLFACSKDSCLHPSSTEVRNAWSCTSTSTPAYLTYWLNTCRDDFTFILLSSTR